MSAFSDDVRLLRGSVGELDAIIGASPFASECLFFVKLTVFKMIHVLGVQQKIITNARLIIRSTR